MEYKRFRVSAVILAAILAIGVIGCSDSGTEPNDVGTVEQPEPVNLMERVPDSLQYNNADAYYGIAVIEGMMSLSQGMYSSINQQYSSSGNTSTFGNVTVTYEAEPETRNGVEGTAWSMIFDGDINTQDTTYTFNNETIFSGWTANDGSAGEFTWDIGAYASVFNISESEDDLYEVNWSTDENGTITSHSTLQSGGETADYTVIINADGSGSYEYTLTDSDGEVVETYSVEWDANGDIISGG